MDDGNHGDGEANDGVYGAVYKITHLAEEIAQQPVEGKEPQVVGSYLVNALGIKGSIWREAQGSFAVQPGRDGDRDRIPDQWEVEHGLDPKNPEDSTGDLDRDKLNAWCEYQLGTDPRNSDTDGGGESDGSETGGECVTLSQDPLDPSDDRVGPLSSIALFPEASGRGIWMRLVLGRPLKGHFVSADLYRRVYAADGRLLSDWQSIGATTEPELVDRNVQDGLGYAYLALPTIVVDGRARALMQEGELAVRPDRDAHQQHP